MRRVDWRLTADVDDTVLVANEVFTLSSLQTILNNIEKSPSLFLVSLNTVRDLLGGVSAVGQHDCESRKRNYLQEVVGLTLHGSDT